MGSIERQNRFNNEKDRRGDAPTEQSPRARTLSSHERAIRFVDAIFRHTNDLIGKLVQPLAPLNSNIVPGQLTTGQQPGRLLSRQHLAVKAEIQALLVIEGRNPWVI